MNNKKGSSVLNQIQIASPCTIDWDSMAGDERVRFCGQCQKNVFNLSQLSAKEAEELVLKTEGKICVRFYQRRDGSMLTEDCPVGLRTIRAGVKRISSAAAAILAVIIGITPSKADEQKEPPPMMGSPLPPPMETALKPWMDTYKKQATDLLVKKINDEKNAARLGDSVEFIVTFSKNGKVSRVIALKCSADQTGYFEKTIKGTTFKAFPKEATEDSANLKLIIPKTQVK